MRLVFADGVLREAWDDESCLYRTWPTPSAATQRPYTVDEVWAAGAYKPKGVAAVTAPPPSILQISGAAAVAALQHL